MNKKNNRLKSGMSSPLRDNVKLRMMHYDTRFLTSRRAEHVLYSVSISISISISFSIAQTPYSKTEGALHSHYIVLFGAVWVTAIRLLVHWPLMGGLLHLVQREGAWAGCGHAQSTPRCTKCNNPPINGQCTNFMLFDVAL